MTNSNLRTKLFLGENRVREQHKRGDQVCWPWPTADQNKSSFSGAISRIQGWVASRTKSFLVRNNPASWQLPGNLGKFSNKLSFSSKHVLRFEFQILNLTIVAKLVAGRHDGQQGESPES